MLLFLFLTCRCRDTHRYAVLQYSYSWKRETNGLLTQGGQAKNWRTTISKTGRHQPGDWQTSVFFFSQRSPTSLPSRARVVFSFLVDLSFDVLGAVMIIAQKGSYLQTQTRPVIELVSGGKGLRPILVGALVPESVDAPEAATIVIEFVSGEEGLRPILVVNGRAPVLPPC